MPKNEAGKGSFRRPSFVSGEEEDLRWQLALGKITREEFSIKLQALNYKKTTCVCGGTGLLEDTVIGKGGKSVKIQTRCMLCKKTGGQDAGGD